MKSTLKTEPMTFRVTKEDRERLTQMAKEKNQSISQLVTDRVFSQDGLTKTQQRSVYHSLLKIRDAVSVQDEPELARIVGEECDSVWQCLNW